MDQNQRDWITKIVNLDVREKPRHDEAGRPLAWLSNDSGLPIHDPHGKARFLGPEELDVLPMVPRYRCRVFRMLHDDELARFEKVWQRHHEGWYVVQAEQSYRDPANGEPLTLLRWIEWYHEIPSNISGALGLTEPEFPW